MVFVLLYLSMVSIRIVGIQLTPIRSLGDGLV